MNLKSLIHSILKEMNVTGGSASFTPGEGMNYATKYAFKKVNQKKLRKAAKGIESKQLWK